MTNIAQSKNSRISDTRLPSGRPSLLPQEDSKSVDRKLSNLETLVEDLYSSTILLLDTYIKKIPKVADNIIQAGAASVIPLTIKQFSSDHSDLQDWQDSSGTILSSIDYTGKFTGKGVDAGSQLITNVANASAGTHALNRDTGDARYIPIASHTACSVVGRSANSSGNEADIAAGSNGITLFRDSNILTFRAITVADVAGSVIGDDNPYHYINGQGYSNNLAKFSQIAVDASDTIANTTTETPFAQIYTLDPSPESWMSNGNIIRLTAYGTYGTNIVAPGLRLRIYLEGVLLLDSSSFTCIAGLSDKGWKAEALIILNDMRDPANTLVEVQGNASFATALTTAQILHLVNTSQLTRDFSGNPGISMTATWSLANAANTITLRQLIAEVL